MYDTSLVLLLECLNSMVAAVSLCGLFATPIHDLLVRLSRLRLAFLQNPNEQLLASLCHSGHTAWTLHEHIRLWGMEVMANNLVIFEFAGDLKVT